MWYLAQKMVVHVHIFPRKVLLLLWNLWAVTFFLLRLWWVEGVHKRATERAKKLEVSHTQVSKFSCYFKLLLWKLIGRLKVLIACKDGVFIICLLSYSQALRIASLVSHSHAKKTMSKVSNNCSKNLASYNILPNLGDVRFDTSGSLRLQKLCWTSILFLCLGYCFVELQL